MAFKDKNIRGPGVRAWVRPLALLLVAVIVLPLFVWADGGSATSSQNIKIYVFYDSDNDNRFNNEDTYLQQGGTLTLTLGTSAESINIPLTNDNYKSDATGSYYYVSINPAYLNMDLKMSLSLLNATYKTSGYYHLYNAAPVLWNSTLKLQENMGIYIPLHYTGSVIGRVIFHDNTNQGFGGVEVKLASDTFSETTKTDPNGNYSIDNVPPGTYTLNIVPSSISDKTLAYTASNETITVANGVPETRVDLKVRRNATVRFRSGDLKEGESTPKSTELKKSISVVYGTLFSSIASEFPDLTETSANGVAAYEVIWYTDATYTKKVDFDSSSSAITEHTEYYAARRKIPIYHTVKFSFRGEIIKEVSIRDGSNVTSDLIPSINSSTYYVNNWYTDSGFKDKFQIGRDTILKDTILYGKPLTYSSSSGSSGSSSRGSTRKDTVSPPKFKNVTATLRDSQIVLKVQMDSSLPVFDYRWQVKDSRDVWVDIPSSNKQTLTLDGIEAGKTYDFRVIAIRDSDGATSTSNVVSVVVPSDNDEMPTMETNNTRPPASTPSGNNSTTSSSAGNSYPTGSNSGYIGAQTLTLSLSSNEFIFEGGRISITPSISGGQWEWDSTMLEGSTEDKAVFTGLKSGIASITYTVDGQSATAEIEIQPAVLPATGQRLTAVYLLGSVGILFVTAAVFLARRRKEASHGPRQ